MFKYFQDYRIEIALESVRRRTDIKPEAATLETIFTERDVPGRETLIAPRDAVSINGAASRS